MSLRSEGGGGGPFETLFMEMEMSSSLAGKPFILGIPFLRAFVGKFDRSKRTIGLASVPKHSNFCAGCSATKISSQAAAGAASIVGPKEKLKEMMALTASSSALLPPNADAGTHEAELRTPIHRVAKMKLRSLHVPDWMHDRSAFEKRFASLK